VKWRREIHPPWSLLVVILVIAVLMQGCGKDPETPATTNPSAEGASQQHFVADNGGKFAPAGKPVAFTPGPAAPKPTAALPANASCVTAECHARLGTAKYIHGPVAQKSCQSCHEDDIGGHKYPLKRSLEETCTHCHSVAGTQKHQHKALEKGCMSCHRPHESETKYLLIADSVAHTCATCHEQPMKKFAHAPFVQGDCMLCHQAHQADNKKLLRGGEGSAHCFTCHTGTKEKIAKADHRHPPAEKDCATCHGPHTTDNRQLLKQTVDKTCLTECHKPLVDHLASAPVQHAAMTMENGCSNCHDAHGTPERGLLRQRMDAMCLTCHNKEIKATDGHMIADMRPTVNAKFRHGPIRSGTCSACHNAHGASKPGLLTKESPRTFYTSFAEEKYELCFTCHEKQLVTLEKTDSLTGFRNGDVNLHYLHVNREEKGRTCKTCHNVHGSENPKHIADDVPFERGEWAMKVGFSKADEGGSCTPSCHKTRDYKRPEKPTTRGSS
jgi:predicted CXXCH cytochrome family protein